MTDFTQEENRLYTSSVVEEYFHEKMVECEGILTNVVGSVYTTVDALRIGLGLAEELSEEGVEPHYKNTHAAAELALSIVEHYDNAPDEVRRLASVVWKPALSAMDTLQELDRFGYSLDTARELAASLISDFSALDSSRRQSDFQHNFNPVTVASAIALHDQAQQPILDRQL